MKFRELAHKMILDNFSYHMINPGNRKNIVNFLNKNLFPDNIAEFIDITSDLDIDIYSIGLSVKYKDILYTLSDFENIYIKMNRIKKLNKINDKSYRSY